MLVIVGVIRYICFNIKLYLVKVIVSSIDLLIVLVVSGLEWIKVIIV